MKETKFNNFTNNNKVISNHSGIINRTTSNNR